MASPHRPASAELTPFLQEPEDLRSANFFSLLRWIEARHPDLPRLGTALSPQDEPLRVRSSPSMQFEPTAMSGINQDIDTGRWHIDQTILSLFGANGALPEFMTVHARQQLQSGDASLARFADIFHHRMLLLFYRAWAVAQPSLTIGDPKHDIARFVGALCGHERITESPGSDNAQRYFAGTLSRCVRNAEGLCHLLEETFQIPVRLRENVPQRIPLPIEQRTCLQRGGPHTALRRSFILGKRVLDGQYRFELRLGPLSKEQYERLLPRSTERMETPSMSPALRELDRWVRRYINLEFDWTVRLILKRDEVPPPQLRRGIRLGQTFWLGRFSHARSADAEDLSLCPSKLRKG